MNFLPKLQLVQSHAALEDCRQNEAVPFGPTAPGRERPERRVVHVQTSLWGISLNRQCALETFWDFTGRVLNALGWNGSGAGGPAVKRQVAGGEPLRGCGRNTNGGQETGWPFWG
ncbi:hypothetical protein CRG98_029446 [Punica granatum]|uniref:Uncharacterized protein n=1 Tax=Punica granatum TaxID=22663 RepID=A0A2I0J1L3_PUNGR|nr:hypothetical protein CRG98_029446 [Punica granatum]